MSSDPLDELARRLAAGLRASGGGQSMVGLFRPVLRLLARGEPVAPEQIAAATGRPAVEVVAALRRLPSAEWDAAGRLVGLGLTLRPTPHAFEVDGRTLFTWCALDTLVFPALLERPARVVSRSPGGGAEVRVQVRPAGVERVEPPEAVVSLVVPQPAENVRRVFCDLVHFFPAPQAAATWLAEHPGAVVLPVEEAFRLGRLVVRALNAAG